MDAIISLGIDPAQNVPLNNHRWHGLRIFKPQYSEEQYEKDLEVKKIRKKLKPLYSKRYDRERKRQFAQQRLDEIEERKANAIKVIEESNRVLIETQIEIDKLEDKLIVWGYI